ncbi:MAG: tetratricopeptide repeat protein [Clostridia bacterium]
MGMMTMVKARNAAAKFGKGDIEGAMQLYKEAMDEGLKDARYLLSYSILLIRAGKFEDARTLLVKMQKYPMNDESRRQLFVNYASVVYKMGELDKGIELLERLHQKQQSGLVYETLGYLYVEAGDYEKALAYNTAACEYDDEDSIVLDNLGQTYYRLGGDKVKAKAYFEKALAVKATQIDTLYFLSQYDIEAGDKDAAREKLEVALKGRFSPLNYATKAMVEAELAKL